MVLLSLDLSSHTGYAVFDNGKLTHYGTAHVENPDLYERLFPDNIYAWADAISDKIVSLIEIYHPDKIVIERVNISRQRDYHGLLEYSHCLFYQKCIKSKIQDKVNYIDTSKWRAAMDVRLSNDDKKNNRNRHKNKKLHRITIKHVAVRMANQIFGLSLLQKDNDLAEAAIQGLAYLKLNN